MTTIGRYEILEQVGTGSMGTVYRARDATLDREVALKTIRTGIEVEPEIRERFFREARACARLQHPNIITVYDLGEEGSMAYIAMELLKGGDFRQAIRSRVEIPVANKLEVIIQVCEALAHAHRHGIIHRDVKPSNLFLVNNCQQAKVLDFGIARLPSSQLTMAGRILGTPNYMSPEQILGKPVDSRSDVFSAAMVFFEFLVYSHPFQSTSIPKRIVDSEPDSLFDHDSTLPALLDRIFARALAKDPAQRYRSSDDFASDVRALLDVMRQNSSPSFWRIPQLPSERALEPAAEPPATPPDPQLLTPAPAGEDPYEWRLSEMMRLIPEFEEAVDRREENQAREILAQLEAIEAVDARFGDAVKLCRTRLSELLSGAMAPTGGHADDDSTTTPKSCPQCKGLNRSAAMFCRYCGSSLASVEPAQPPSAPPPPPPSAAKAETSSSTLKRPTAEEAATLLFKPRAGAIEPSATGPGMIPPQGPPNTPALGTTPAPPHQAPPRVDSQTKPGALAFFSKLPRSQQILAGVVALAALLLIGILLFVTLSPPPVAPFVATAEAEVKTNIYKEQSIGSGVIATLQPGRRVNVLKAPTRRSQSWVPVQLVNGDTALRPGFARTGDLHAWDSSNPDTALTLLGMFLLEDLGEGGAQAGIEALQKLAHRFPETAAERKAQLQTATLEIQMIERSKALGEPAEAWQGRLDSARNHIAAANRDPSLQGQVATLTDKINQLAGPPPPNPPDKQPNPPGGAQPPVNLAAMISVWMKQANDLLHERKYDEAERAVNRVLQVRPQDTDARALLKKIQGTRDFFQH